MTYQSPVFGSLLRRFVLFSVTTSKHSRNSGGFNDSGKIIAFDLVSHAKDHHHNEVAA